MEMHLNCAIKYYFVLLRFEWQRSQYLFIAFKWYLDSELKYIYWQQIEQHTKTIQK